MVDRIPAWKRLGLKLKNTTDSAGPLSGKGSIVTQSAPDVNTNKRKREEDDDKSKDARKTKSKRPISSTPIQSTNSLADVEDSPRKIKSVSFTSETKVDDGHSAQELHEQTLNLPGEPPIVPSKKRKKPKSKSKAKSKSKTGSASAKSPSGPPPYLEYLDTFHKNHSRWKFNKNLQSTLLKNCFDVELVPDDYSEALDSYVRGLHGKMARDRLADSAREVIVELSSDEDESGENDTNKNEVEVPDAHANDQGKLDSEAEIPRPYTNDWSSTTMVVNPIEAAISPHVLHTIHGKVKNTKAYKEKYMKRLRVTRILQALAAEQGDPRFDSQGRVKDGYKNLNGMNDGFAPNDARRGEIDWTTVRTGVPDDDDVHLSLAGSKIAMDLNQLGETEKDTPEFKASDAHIGSDNSDSDTEESASTSDTESSSESEESSSEESDDGSSDDSSDESST